MLNQDNSFVFPIEVSTLLVLYSLSSEMNPESVVVLGPAELGQAPDPFGYNPVYSKNKICFPLSELGVRTGGTYRFGTFR